MSLTTSPTRRPAPPGPDGEVERPPPVSVRARAGRRHLPVHWPLTALLVGYPVWWLLGIAFAAPVLAAAVMVLQLARRRTVRTPPAFLLWLLFLLWVVLSSTMLWVDAPSAVPGGAGPGRLAVAALRLSEYTAVTVVLLWVGTLTEAELPRRWVRSCLAWLFVTTVVGGLAGVLVPQVDFPSALELVLPRSIASDGFVSSLVHPGLADIQTVLGYEEARPKAPFDFTNTWGANLSMLLPFFVIAWVRDGRRWQRVAAPLVLLAGAVPVVLSLNRALWATLAVAAVALVLVLARHGRRIPLMVAGAALVGVVAVLVVSPLGSVLGERLDNPHSNERRGQLLEQTVASASAGSPVLGFGSTREVQGSYASIAGGATADCSACAVPPLGTQGQLWLVIFSQGLVGAGLFLAWLGVLGSWCWRAATTSQALLLFPLGAFLVQLPVYDTLGMPLLTLMVAAALVWRERPPPRGSTLAAGWRAVRHDGRLVAGCAAAGLLAGGLLALADREPTYAARSAFLLVPAPVALTDATALAELTGETVLVAGNERARRATIDTEAALAVSDETLLRVTGGSSAEAADLRSRTVVTAPPNTQVLVVEVRAPSPAEAEDDVRAVLDSYSVTRRGYLQDRKAQAVTEVQRELRALTATAPEVPPGTVDPDDATADSVAVETALRAALQRLDSTSVSAGQMLRSDPPELVRPAREVPVVSGLALGLLVGVGVGVARRAVGRRR